MGSLRLQRCLNIFHELLSDLMTGDWIELYDDLRSRLGLKEKHVIDLGPRKRELFLRATDMLRERFVLKVVGERELRKAERWIGELRKCASALCESLGLNCVLYTRELGSFISDPLAHLKKKIFVYTFDLLVNKIRPDEFERKASAALRTSLRTNMRSVYQTWVFLELLYILSSKASGSRLLYPEHGVLAIERSGRQRLGQIPPNCVLEVAGKGYLSFFLEVPRPIAWGDSHDLARAWKLYVALRPDMMMYGGVVMDIVDLSNDPPVKRPDFVLECKELPDWYVRVRDLKGQFSRPLSAEEWRVLWLKGLWDGLAMAMGVKKRDVIRMLREERSVRLREPQLVRLYQSVYRPEHMALVSRTPVPKDVKDELEASGISVHDGIGFKGERLENLASDMASLAKGRIHSDLLSEIAALLGLKSFDRRALRKAILKLISENLEDLKKKLEKETSR